MNEWISVEDRLPDKWDEPVLAFYMTVHGGVMVTAFYGLFDWAIMCAGHRTDVTHWMTLPEPPEATVAKAQGE